MPSSGSEIDFYCGDLSMLDFWADRLGEINDESNSNLSRSSDAESECNVEMKTIDNSACVTSSAGGKWTSEEHRLFVESFKKYGKNWKKLGTIITTRTVLQIRTHTQKYLQKLERASRNPNKVLSRDQKELLSKHVSF